jgi:hypothetical protein
VELDMFSGRPNPSWQLSADEATQLARRLTGLPAAAEPAEQPVLGYRGLVISTTDAGDRGPDWTRVHGGIVSIGESRNARRYRDANGVEQWLLESARNHGLGALVEEILKRPAT